MVRGVEGLSVALRGALWRNGRLILPQFRYRTPINDFILGPIPTPGTAIFNIGPIGDVLIDYIVIFHNSGVAKVFDVKFTLDGITVNGSTSFNAGVDYYAFLRPGSDGLSFSTTRTQFNGFMSQYAQSFRGGVITPGNTGIVFLNIDVRYQQL